MAWRGWTPRRVLNPEVPPLPALAVRVLPDAASAAHAAATHIAGRLDEAIRSRGLATLAVSGGSSPAPMFDALAAQSLAWPRVHVFQVDERVVERSSPDRNWNLATDRLLAPTGAIGHPLTIGVKLTPRAASLVRTSDAAAIGRLAGASATLDVVHLGLGNDGHTASWPPGRDLDTAPGALIVAVARFNGHDRVTLTPAAVNAARCIVWFVPGQSKMAVLAKLRAGDPAIPASLVSRPQAVVFTDAVLDTAG